MLKIQDLKFFLLSQVSPENFNHVIGGWINDVPCDQVAESLKVPVELVRGIYFYKDFLWFEMEEYEQWYSDWKKKTEQVPDHG